MYDENFSELVKQFVILLWLFEILLVMNSNPHGHLKGKENGNNFRFFCRVFFTAESPAVSSSQGYLNTFSQSMKLLSDLGADLQRKFMADKEEDLDSTEFACMEDYTMGKQSRRMNPSCQDGFLFPRLYIWPFLYFPFLSLQSSLQVK